MNAALSGFGWTTGWTISAGTVIKDTTIFAVAAFFGGIVLLLLNRPAVRALEGYWPWGLQSRLSSRQRERYRSLRDRIRRLDELRNEKRSKGEDLSIQERIQRIRFKQREANDFPDAEHWVLPTSFGNAFRAFEVYSRVMYGFDAIAGWPRLMAVMPKDYRTLVDAARAPLDFWVNVCCLSFFVTFGYSGLLALAHYRAWPVTPPAWEAVLATLLAAVLTVFGYKMATLAARGWGTWVKASFDVFLPELREKLGFPAPATLDEERELWTSFSRATIYRAPASLPERAVSEDGDRPQETEAPRERVSTRETTASTRS